MVSAYSLLTVDSSSPVTLSVCRDSSDLQHWAHSQKEAANSPFSWVDLQDQIYLYNLGGKLRLQCSRGMILLIGL